ncbi:hypothetical protein MBLNU230_g0155t1 [Neophaeotheca triangularis]
MSRRQGSKQESGNAYWNAEKGLGLGIYTADPNGPGRDRVVTFNDDFVIIRDLFPKSMTHLLILPRDREKQLLRPQEAFDDPEFLEKCRREEATVRAMVAEELRRTYAKDSSREKARMAAMETEDPPEDFELPAGRDWNNGIISGIHANPSMAHLHIHVMSRDMCGPSMNKVNHYLSFNTGFLVGLDQFPLAEEDYRRNFKQMQEELICWRCGRDFGRSFAKLRAHLKDELKDWAKE